MQTYVISFLGSGSLEDCGAQTEPHTWGVVCPGIHKVACRGQGLEIQKELCLDVQSMAGGAEDREKLALA